MSWTTMEGWSGRIWVAENGKRTFYIRQVRDGKRWDVSTKCSTLRAALNELGRFEMDPEAYRPQGSGARLVLNESLIEAYAKWCRESGENTDPRWVEAKKRYLHWWAECFDLRPLTNMKLSRILECLDGQVSRADRIKSLKHLYSWLRQTDQLLKAEDPTLDALPVPQSRPEQDTTGESKVISEDDFRKVLPKLPPMIADACRVLAGTGCHLSEVLRLIQSGKIEERPLPALPVLCFRHKGGHLHRVEVVASVADAAKRIIGGRVPGRSTVYHAIDRACASAGVEPWTPGRFRHTFATSAIGRGVPAHEVALALGHRGAFTTLKWYATTAVAPRVAGGYE
jgi:integrase